MLDLIDALTISSHATSPIVHIYRRSLSAAAAKALKPATPALRDAPSFDIACEKRLLQDIAKCSRKACRSRCCVGGSTLNCAQASASP